jgi:UDP-glucuronate 4-epimerase
MRALVTGCAGFIGSNLVDDLLSDGHDVVGVDCFNDNYGRRQKLRNLGQARSWDRFDFVPVDLSRGAVEDLVADCDVVFHLAAEPGVRSSWGQRFDSYLRNNVLATQHLLEAARAESPSKRFVFASSSSIYGQAERFPTPEDVIPCPQSPYGATKLAAEHLCGLYRSNFGVDTVSLRLFSVFGPRQRPDMAFSNFFAALLSGRPATVLGDGRQTRDFTYVGDVVRALRIAADVKGLTTRVFNIGGGARTSLMEVIGIIEDLAGAPLPIEMVQAVRGDVRDTAADTGLAHRQLGFEPQTSLREGLEAQFRWMPSTLGRGSSLSARDSPAADDRARPGL